MELTGGLAGQKVRESLNKLGLAISYAKYRKLANLFVLLSHVVQPICNVAHAGESENKAKLKLELG